MEGVIGGNEGIFEGDGKMEVGIKHVLFDVDGTLVRDFNSDQLMPHVQKYFEQLECADYSFALATNQGGVGYRLWGESKGIDGRSLKKYPTVNQAYNRLMEIRGQISSITKNPIPIYVSYQYKDERGEFLLPCGVSEWDWNWRKPGTGMLTRALFNWGVSPQFVRMVGDSVSDELCAVGAGVNFSWASEFFHGYF